MEFVHYSATGNTFLIFDDRSNHCELENVSKWNKVADEYGVDGLLFVQKSDEHDFSMRYLNRDGTEVEMCGNGARAICTFAHEELDIPLGDNGYHFQTYNGPLQANKNSESFAIAMGNPRDFNMVEVDDLFDATNSLYTYTGVPHVVYQVEDIDSINLVETARPIRYDDRFEKGTNINFYHLDENGKCYMRTYERGVEAETLSCGTGTVAVALSLFRHHEFRSPVQIKAPGGLLTISWEGEFENPKLSGPVDLVKRGNLS